MTNGLQARKEKIETITNKVQEVSKKVEEIEIKPTDFTKGTEVTSIPGKKEIN